MTYGKEDCLGEEPGSDLRSQDSMEFSKDAVEVGLEIAAKKDFLGNGHGQELVEDDEAEIDGKPRFEGLPQVEASEQEIATAI